MTDDQPDERDPVAAAFQDYVARPKDIVRRQPDASVCEIPSGLGVECYSDDLGDDGLTRETEGWSITTPPILDAAEFMEQRRARREAQDDA